MTPAASAEYERLKKMEEQLEKKSKDLDVRCVSPPAFEVLYCNSLTVLLSTVSERLSFARVAKSPTGLSNATPLPITISLLSRPLRTKPSSSSFTPSFGVRICSHRGLIH